MQNFQVKTIQYFFILICLFNLSKTKAQEIRGFGNVSLYYASEDFKKGLITDLGGGVEFGFHPLFKPEVSVSYSIIGVRDIKEYNEVENSTEIIKKNVSSFNFTIGPKIYFWFDKDDDDNVVYSYYIVPKINMSRITANQNYSFMDHDIPLNSFDQKNRISDWQHSFGLTIGMEYPLSQDSSNSIAFSVNLTNVNMGKTLNRLPHNEIDYNTIGVGVGISYYFGIKKNN